MATYYVQPIKDKQNRLDSWEVAKKHGRGTTRIADHDDHYSAVSNARRVAKKGDKIAIKNLNGSFKRWEDA